LAVEILLFSLECEGDEDISRFRLDGRGADTSVFSLGCAARSFCCSERNGEDDEDTSAMTSSLASRCDLVVAFKKMGDDCVADL